MSIRSFIALALPQELANSLGDMAAKMAYQDKSNAVRWVDQANYHLTLAFLGDQDEQILETVAEQLDDHLPQATNIELQVTHFSPFPESRPKLIAAMIRNSSELKDLQQNVQSSLIASDLVLERRRFTPHVTLGRFRHSRNQYVGGIPLPTQLSALASEVVLYESILSPSGAEYEPIYRFPLDYSDYHFDDD